MTRTINGVRGPLRTTAATAARRRRRAERLALELAPRVGLLDGQWLMALADVVLDEIEDRGLPYWEEADGDVGPR